MGGANGVHQQQQQVTSQQQQKTKRLRTSFKHHQLRMLKSYFATNHNPDAKDLKQLSQKTTLSKRVLQVMEQNKTKIIVIFPLPFFKVVIFFFYSRERKEEEEGIHFFVWATVGFYTYWETIETTVAVAGDSERVKQVFLVG